MPRCAPGPTGSRCVASLTVGSWTYVPSLGAAAGLFAAGICPAAGHVGALQHSTAPKWPSVPRPVLAGKNDAPRWVHMATCDVEAIPGKVETDFPSGIASKQ